MSTALHDQLEVAGSTAFLIASAGIVLSAALPSAATFPASAPSSAFVQTSDWSGTADFLMRYPLIARMTLHGAYSDEADAPGDAPSFRPPEAIRLKQSGFVREAEWRV